MTSPCLQKALDDLRAQGCTPYAHQVEGIRRLMISPSLLLADDMGTGKTLMVLAAAEGRPLLVVCPVVAKGVWVAEAARWTPNYRVSVLDGRGSFRWPEAGEIVITNYEILSDKCGPAPAHVAVALDEAHKIKSPKAIMTKRCRAICHAARVSQGATWLLTATPLTKDPRDLWSLLEAVKLERRCFANKSESITGARSRRGSGLAAFIETLPRHSRPRCFVVAKTTCSICPANVARRSSSRA